MYNNCTLNFGIMPCRVNENVHVYLKN